MPDMTGRTVVVTGASAGIGLVAAQEFAGAGARVISAVRNVEKGRTAVAALPGSIEVRTLDLASLQSVRDFVADWEGNLDVLVNNAGIMQVPFVRTADGFESQIAVNYLGPFVLTNLLLPYVTDRVVTVSSQLHRVAKLRVDDLNWEKRKYRELRAYCDSKLADLLFTLELQRRLDAAGSGVRSVAAHPGIAKTTLVSHAGGLTGGMMKLGFLLNDPLRGALPTLYAATQDISGGSYVGPDGLFAVKGYPRIGTASKKARNAELARELWEATERLTGTAWQSPSGR
jgi:NAD(P)-dependent dehydrogenase (short-subunit alcohol dehydrogenase family)